MKKLDRSSKSDSPKIGRRRDSINNINQMGVSPPPALSRSSSSGSASSLIGRVPSASSLAVEHKYQHVDNLEELAANRAALMRSLIANPDFLGALGQCLSRSETNRSKLFKLFEELVLRLADKNDCVLSGLLRGELSSAKDASTVLRGNSNVTRCTVAVLKRPTGLCKVVEEWMAASTNAGGGEEAGLELVATLKGDVDKMQPELKRVVKTVSSYCAKSELLKEATLPLVGGIVFLRLVCPMLMTRAVGTAKVLQSASNNPKVVTRLSAAVKDYLETLLSVSEGFADASEERALENNLSESDTLKMIQMMAIHREDVAAWLGEKNLSSADKINEVGALLDKCDPFRAAKTMVAMKGVASPSLAERGREEKQFFDAFGLTAEFLAQYFASDSVQVDAVVRVASFCFHEKFGVPAKKGLIVGRDLVDWLADIGGVDDRAKAIKLSEDFVTHRLLTSQISGDKKKCVFVDGDAFFRIDRNLLDQLQSLLENVEEKNDKCCPQCGKQSKKLNAQYCEYCGFGYDEEE